MHRANCRGGGFGYPVNTYVVMGTGTSARKPRGGAINVGIGILTIKLRQEINRLR